MSRAGTAEMGPWSMDVIVVGCGRVGSQLATMLSVEGHNVTVIDRDD